jgi:hypothetical protein
MFLTLLGGTLVLGASLLAAANYTEGALVAARTAAQVIGWLLAGAALLGLQQASWQKVGAASVAFFSAAALLYVSYFQWNEVPAVRVPLAATVASDWVTYKFTPVLAAEVVGTLSKAHASASPLPEVDYAPAKRIVASAAPVQPALAQPVLAQPVGDACAAFGGVEALQCRRCNGANGIGGIVCRESARLEYCENAANDAVACPAAISYSPPG